MTTKRRRIFFLNGKMCSEYLRQQNSSIIFLQEAHLKFEAECFIRSGWGFIRSGWGFECFLSGAGTNKNGVAVLFNNTLNIKCSRLLKIPVDGLY